MDKLRGTKKSKIDAMGRVVIPSQHREFFRSDSLALTGHPFGYAMLMDRTSFEKLEEKVNRQPDVDEQAVYHKNVFIGMAEADVIFDKLGRITVPQVLREHAGLKAEVIIFGRVNHLQLWQPQTWAKLAKKSTKPGFQSSPEGWTSITII